jgi:hypothetical protein
MGQAPKISVQKIAACPQSPNSFSTAFCTAPEKPRDFAALHALQPWHATTA